MFFSVILTYRRLKTEFFIHGMKNLYFHEMDKEMEK